MQMHTGHLKGQLCLPTSVCPSSDCCLSRDHISETKKDRPIVIMEHSIKIGTADSVAAFRSSPHAR